LPGEGMLQNLAIFRSAWWSYAKILQSWHGILFFFLINVKATLFIEINLNCFLKILVVLLLFYVLLCFQSHPTVLVNYLFAKPLTNFPSIFLKESLPGIFVNGNVNAYYFRIYKNVVLGTNKKMVFRKWSKKASSSG